MEASGQLLSLAEVSQLLGISRRTVLRWLESGKIEGVRVGERLVKVPREALTRILSPYRPRKRPQAARPEEAPENPFLNVDDWAPKAIKNAPRDLAQRHDLYLYGVQEEKTRR